MNTTTGINHSTATGNSTEARAAALLGTGLSQEVVASTLGVTAARITQLISDPQFMEEVIALRYKNLQQHNVRDAAYDSIEDALIEKLKQSLPLMFRPMEVLKAIQVINLAKRRGQSNPDSIVNQQTVVNLTMPTQIVKKYTTNIHNQVISAGTQELLTMQSSDLQSLVSARSKKAAPLQVESTKESISHENYSERVLESAGSDIASY